MDDTNDDDDDDDGDAGRRERIGMAVRGNVAPWIPWMVGWRAGPSVGDVLMPAFLMDGGIVRKRPRGYRRVVDGVDVY